MIVHRNPITTTQMNIMKGTKTRSADLQYEDLRAFEENRANPPQLRRVAAWLRTDAGQEYLSAGMDRDIELIENGANASQDVPQSVSIDILSRIDKVLNRRRMLLRTGAAAAILIPLLFLNIMILQRTAGPGDKNIVYRSVHVPAGEQLRMILADGTGVMLNSETSFEYPERFHRRHRTVKVDGEAYFEVAHDKKHPFFAMMKGVTVEVLGTKFNINTGDRPDAVSVYLAEGSVRLHEHISGAGNSYLMRPGQMALIDNSSGACRIDRGDRNKTLGWMHKRYFFKNAPLEDVVRLLEKSYGVTIGIEAPELYGYTYTMSFSNESVDEILSQMETITPIRYVNSNGRITISPK